MSTNSNGKKKIAQPVECLLVCSYPRCSVTSNDAQLMEPSPQSPAVALNISSSLYHLVLCTKHAEAHRKLASPQCCTSFGPRGEHMQFTRHCPDPEQIDLVLLENISNSRKLAGG